MRIRDVQGRIHEWSKLKGWMEAFEAVRRVEGQDGFRLQAAMIAEKLALVHSELSEALEVLRTAKSLEDLQRVWLVGTKNKPEGFGTELADAHIRLWDLEAMLGIDSENMLIAKLTYNDVREYKHGGKLL